jgi:hypothetical protein
MQLEYWLDSSIVTLHGSEGAINYMHGDNYMHQACDHMPWQD